MLMICLLLPYGLTQGQSSGSPARVLKLEASIRLPHVMGRIDHMDMDPSTSRVFVAALGNNTVEVIDLKKRKWLLSLTGFNEPQGILCLPDIRRLYVTNGGNATCSVLDLSTLKVVKEITGLEDADNIRYDRSAQKTYVGFGTGGLAAIDSTEIRASSTLSFRGHPESFQIEEHGTMIYVNVPYAKKVLVFDKIKRRAVAEWSVDDAGNNFPMALDEQDGILFVGCRTPPRLLVFNTHSGVKEDEIPIGADVDDIFVDAGKRRVYVSCGEGTVRVIGRNSPGRWREIDREISAQGARTSLFVPSLDLLLVAAPARNGRTALAQRATAGRQAELLVYSVGPH